MSAQREILVIREKDDFSALLAGYGFSVTNFPTIKTEPVEDLTELENYLARIETFSGIFITSAKSAEIVSAILKGTGAEFRGKFYVLGKASNELLTTAGFDTFFREQAATVEELLAAIPETDLRGKRFLFPRGNISLRAISEKLRGIADLRETIVYRTLATTETDERQSVKIKSKLETGGYTAVCFFSPSGVENFLLKIGGGGFDQNLTKIAAIGKTTARYAESVNLRVDFVARKPAAEYFAAELTAYLKQQES